MERLQKVLAHAGVASRRQAEKIISSGRVQVNGQVVTEMGTKVDESDEILVDGQPIAYEKKRYILLHKPKNTISSVTDPEGRKTVIDIIGNHVQERLYPVGRLDFDTTGALLLTNDGELTQQLIHPKYEFSKTYRVLISGKLTAKQKNLLQKGLMIDGEMTAPAKLKVIKEIPGQSIIDLSIHEGRYHQVKKMFAAVDSPVIRLHRTHFGPLSVQDLKAGEWRELTEEEINRLKRYK